MDALLQDLTEDDSRWKHVNDELRRLETLFREIGSMFDANMFGERPLDEKQQILEVRVDIEDRRIYDLFSSAYPCRTR